jgi:hypothetical protein
MLIYLRELASPSILSSIKTSYFHRNIASPKPHCILIRSLLIDLLGLTYQLLLWVGAIRPSFVDHFSTVYGRAAFYHLKPLMKSTRGPYLSSRNSRNVLSCIILTVYTHTSGMMLSWPLLATALVPPFFMKYLPRPLLSLPSQD